MLTPQAIELTRIETPGAQKSNINTLCCSSIGALGLFLSPLGLGHFISMVPNCNISIAREWTATMETRSGDTEEAMKLWEWGQPGSCMDGELVYDFVLAMLGKAHHSRRSTRLLSLRRKETHLSRDVCWITFVVVRKSVLLRSTGVWRVME